MESEVWCFSFFEILDTERVIAEYFTGKHSLKIDISFSFKMWIVLWPRKQEVKKQQQQQLNTDTVLLKSGFLSWRRFKLSVMMFRFLSLHFSR